MRWIYSVYCFFMLILLLLFSGPLILICCVRNTPKAIDTVYAALGIVAGLWFRFCFIKHRAVNAGFNSGRQYLYIANHSSYLDILSVMRSLRRPYRILGKEEIGKIPLVGFCYRRIVISVDRGDVYDRARALRRLEQKLEEGISLMVFPEGTFNETTATFKSFYDGIFKLALATGIPVKPMLLPDNKRRMHYSSFKTINPGLARVVFLQEVAPAQYQEDQLLDMKQDTLSLMKEAWRKCEETT